MVQVNELIKQKQFNLSAFYVQIGNKHLPKEVRYAFACFYFNIDYQFFKSKVLRYKFCGHFICFWYAKVR